MLEVKLHSGEHVILSLRKHPLILLGSLLPFIVLDYIPYLLPKAAAFVASSAGAAMPLDLASALSFGNPWFDFIVGIYWLFVWMGMFGVFTDYFLDQWIVTNERVIDINQKSFWRREVTSLFLNRVQNVESDVGGVFHTLFGFGTVTVESAGAEEHKIRMPGLPGPGHVRDVILQEIAKRHGAGVAPSDAKQGL